MNLGVYRGSGRPDLIPGYVAWLGAPLTHVVDFLPGSWAAIDSPTWWLGKWAPTPYALVLTVPMFPSGCTLEAGARGDYDTHWRSFARALVAKNMQGRTVVRLGHEPRVPSYSWYCKGKEAAYAAYFRRVVSVVRAVAGRPVRFEWCMLAGGGINAEAAYPGNSAVDVIGLDIYDIAKAGTTGRARWDLLRTAPYSLEWHKAFAAKQGKPRAFSEWGVVDVAHGGAGDNPFYVERMVEWTSAAAYACYFEVNAPDGAHRLMPGSWTNFPKAAAKYRGLV